MTSLKQNLIQSIKIIAIALVLGLGIGILEAAWTPAPGTPPSGNPDAPLNVGASAQEKSGGIVFNTGGATYGLVVATGNVGIGILDPQAKLEVGGNVRITGGNPTAGKALVATDNLGNATWSKVGFTNVQAYTAAGNYAWTVPAGVTRIFVEAWGGGGKGGTAEFISSCTIHGGNGGGGGGYAASFLNVSPGATLDVRVGAGGTATTPTGGLSSFGSDLVVANGGAGGSASSATGVGGAGGGGTGTIVSIGGNGLKGDVNGGANQITIGGAGGAGGGGGGAGGAQTYYASCGGLGGPACGHGPGGPGKAPGGGGAGGGGTTGTGACGSGPFEHAGGNGGAGRLLIWY